MTNKLKLFLLGKILIQSGIPSRDFSLKGYSEDRVCLEVSDNIWKAYMCERGHKVDEFVSTDFESVIYNFIDKLTETDAETELIVNRYFKELKRRHTTRRLRPIKTTIRESKVLPNLDPIIHSGTSARRIYLSERKASRSNVSHYIANHKMGVHGSNDRERKKLFEQKKSRKGFQQK